MSIKQTPDTPQPAEEPLTIQVSDLLQLLGQKEVERAYLLQQIAALRQQTMQLREQIARLTADSASAQREKAGGPI